MVYRSDWRLSTLDPTYQCNTLLTDEVGVFIRCNPERGFSTRRARKLRCGIVGSRGESLHQIAQLFNRCHTSVRGIIAASDGIRPPSRRRAARALSLAEREEISRGIALSHSIRSIANGFSRAPSTISREIRRNGGTAQYRATVADQAAWRRASRPKPCKLGEHDRLAREVAEKLQKQWSPEQIAGWLKQTYPDDPSRQVSHETIYRTLFIQSRGALKKELLAHLRRTRAMRRSRHHTQKTDNHGRITGTVSISERLA